MELFYHEQIDNQTKVFKLEGEEHIHIKKVLRKKEGQIVKFTMEIVIVLVLKL